MSTASTFPVTIVALGDALANLRVAEAVQLKNYLRERYRIEPASASSSVVLPPKPIIDPPPPPPPVKTSFDVTIDGVTDETKRLAVLKVLREATGCSLLEGKQLLEGGSKTIRQGVSVEEAESLRQKLTSAGARVCVE